MRLAGARNKDLKRWVGGMVTAVEDADRHADKIHVQVISYNYTSRGKSGAEDDKEDEEHWQIPPIAKEQTKVVQVSREYLRRPVEIDKTYFDVPAPLVVPVCMSGNYS